MEGPAREYVYDLTLCTQSGTHVQGPHYFLPEGERIAIEHQMPFPGAVGSRTTVSLVTEPVVRTRVPEPGPEGRGKE